MRQLKTLILRIFFILIITIFIIIVIVGIDFYQFSNKPLSYQQKEFTPTTIIIYPGMNIPNLMNELQRRHLLSHPIYFKLLALYRHAYFRLKIGEYLITSETTANDLLNNILQGKIYLRKITFIEGWTFRQMQKALNKNSYLRHQLSHQSDQEIMKKVSNQSDLSPEGMFFPSTYEYTWGNTDLLILKTSYQYMKRFLHQNWLKRDSGLPYQTPYQVLIVASMVERETALNQEKPIIAGIILQRLQKGMRLQIDPTVLYGVQKDYKSAITHDDLLNKNAYNTYRNKGLPPTPIAMPSAASILAALHPRKTDYLYFVAKGEGGGHRFSKTYAGQRIAVTHYRNKVSSDKDNLEKCDTTCFPWKIILLDCLLEKTNSKTIPFNLELNQLFILAKKLEQKNKYEEK